MGPGGGWGGALAPTPELLAKVDALEPATADPHVDVAFESAESHNFKFLRFLQRYRGWLLVGMLLVALDAVCTLAGPLLVRYGIDNGVAEARDERALGRVDRVLPHHALRLVGDVGGSSASSGARRNGSCTRCGSRCSAISNGSASTTTSRRWRAAS